MIQYFQKATQRKQSCQIDLLIQTRHKTLYVCEIKFSKNELNVALVEEVTAKCQRIAVPKNVSFRPVLIHVNGVSESLEEAQYFAHIIDFAALLKGSTI